MICIKIPSGCKWHYERHGRALCGVRGVELDRRDVALASEPEMVCGNCDRELRRLGRATRLARNLKAAPPRGTVYRPVHRERFVISVIHLAKAALATTDPED